MNPFDLLFGFQGRVNRAKFWVMTLIYVIAMSVIWFFNATFGATIVLYVPIIISAVAVGLKRLHDRDKSGWWLAAFALPLVLPFIATPLDDLLTPQTATTFTFFQYVSLAIIVWAAIELGCVRGTIGPNEHGPDPVAPAPAPVRTLR
jgi:uncharacterized membrane protein YhaH (DUF805 family)